MIFQEGVPHVLNLTKVRYLDQVRQLCVSQLIESAVVRKSLTYAVQMAGGRMVTQSEEAPTVASDDSSLLVRVSRPS